MKNFISLMTSNGGGKFGLVLGLVFFGYFANCQTIAVGTASPSGYSKLSDALFYSHIVLDANGDLVDDLLIQGYFEMDSSLQHISSAITFDGSAILGITANVDYLSCNFHSTGSGSIKVRENTSFNNGDFNTLNEITISDQALCFFNDMYFNDFSTGVRLNNGEVDADYSDFYKTSVRINNSVGGSPPLSAYWNSFSCNFFDVTGTAVTILNGYYWGIDVNFENCDNGILLNPISASGANSQTVINWQGKFKNISGQAINAQTGGTLNVFQTEFENCGEPIRVENMVGNTYIQDTYIFNSTNGIYSDNNNQLLIKDNLIYTITGGTNESVIYVNNDLNGEILSNSVNVSNYGIKLENSDGTEVGSNVMFGINGSFTSGVIDIDDSENLNIHDNIINGNSSFFGYKISDVNASLIIDNDADNCQNNMVVNRTMGTTVETNNLLNADFINLNVTASQSMIYECNRIENAAIDGARFYGNNMILDYRTNKMEGNTTHGLYYHSDVTADQQIDKGNCWTMNGVTEARHAGSGQQIIDSRYEMQNLSCIYTTAHSPMGWFDNIGSQTPTCQYREGGDGIENPDGDEIAALEHSIDCENLETGEGHCVMNQMVAYHILDLHPELKNQSTILQDFYEDYSNALASELDLPAYFIASLPEIPTLEPIPVPQVSYDASNDELIYNEQAFLDFENTNADEIENHRLAKLNDIESEIDYLNTISFNDVLLEDYRELFVLFLKELKEHYQLSTEEYDRVLFLAEQCVGDYGPAVYLARALAMENDIQHDKSDDCSGSRQSLSEKEHKLMIYPNPSNGAVTIEKSQNVDQVLIYNLLGELVYSKSLENQSTIRLDLSDLQTGVYWIRTSDSLPGQKILIQR